MVGSGTKTKEVVTANLWVFVPQAIFKQRITLLFLIYALQYSKLKPILRMKWVAHLNSRTYSILVVVVDYKIPQKGAMHDISDLYITEIPTLK
ncbi:MAG TPA: hypothetical protein ENH91_03305 [Leeuwenhoekiella sp.]|nr:hypothetical protein [Leeuwenhoekiella sp.]